MVQHFDAKDSRTPGSVDAPPMKLEIVALQIIENNMICATSFKILA